MSIQLQGVLIALTLVCFIFLIKSVRKGKLESDYAVGWILCSLALVVVSVFPQIAYWGAKILHVASPANMVFAFVTFLLIILVYILFTKVSKLEERVRNLVQELAFTKEDIKQQNNRKD